MRFEDLVTDPESKLREICEIIGEPFDPRMLTVDGGNSRKFSTKSIGRYAGDVPIRDIALIERVLGLEMEHLGYRPSGRSLRWVERLGLEILDRPAAAIFLILWRPVSALRRRFSSGPSSRRTVSDG